MSNTAVIAGEYSAAHGQRTVTIYHDGAELVCAWVVSDAEVRQLLREYTVAATSVVRR